MFCGEIRKIVPELSPNTPLHFSCWTQIYPAFANSVDPDHLASKKLTDLDLHCLPFSIWIYINNLDQVIWLAENLKKRRGILIYSGGQGLATPLDV